VNSSKSKCAKAIESEINHIKSDAESLIKAAERKAVVLVVFAKN